MPSITTEDGVRLHYSEHGDPKGRPVVLIAGFLAAATSWKYQHGALADAGYRVLSFDRRGRTVRTSRPRDDHESSWRRHRSPLGQLELTNTVLVGASMGGNAIWSYIASFGTEHVDGIVIVDQTPRMLAAADWTHGFYGYDFSNLTLFSPIQCRFPACAACFQRVQFG